MRYHYEKPELYSTSYGIVYQCNHPVYDVCTLYLVGDKGLAVIQQRFSELSKTTWWGPIDDFLTDALYLNSGFKKYFDNRAKKSDNGFYPTVTIRQIMWALKMKPLPKARWETTFDRKDI